MRPHTIRSFFTFKRTRWFVSAMAIVALVVGGAVPVLANVTGSNFESGDGNLTVDTSGNTDWNSFSPTWTGTAPYRTAAATANGWTFAGFEDAQKSSSDTGFAGGTKQNDNCPAVIGTKSPNKDDLKRIYLADKIGSNGHVFLTLAWIRVPLNSTSSSAHVGFEFNQGSTPCPTGSDGLVNRTAGDMLIVYDFEGGTNAPTITIRRWVTSGACEVGTTFPCWGPASTNLITAGDAEAAVNSTTVQDTVAPTTESLGQFEFGEAGVDLTAAGVFSSTQCTAFGQAEGVSRSSGDSGTAAMEDLDGPGPFTVSNCGTIKIHKTTIPAGGTGFGYTTTGAAPLGGGFTLDDGGTQTFSNVPIGNYSVTESAKTGWTFVSLACTATGSGTSSSTSGATASITLAAAGVVDCTYTNHIHKSPTITTAFSPPSPVNTNTTVTDSATLTGATADAGGTVTYTVYSDNACKSAVANTSSTVTVSNGSVPNSSPVTFDSAGTFYWQAAYSGDTFNDAAKSNCTSETLIVKTNPSITTAFSPASPVSIGTAVTDSATLTGATADAGGTVTYTVYSDNACKSAVANTSSTVTVSNGSVPNSSPVTFDSAGTFYWQAAYSGDGKNNGATSACTSEQVVVNKNTPAISTVQNLKPNDIATISGATNTAGGTITFSLFSPSDATCSGTPAYTQTVNVTGNRAYNTSNSTFIASASGEWRWQVVYSGDSNNQGTTSACGVENFTITNG